MYPIPTTLALAAFLTALAGWTPAELPRRSVAPAGKGCPLAESVWKESRTAPRVRIVRHRSDDVRILSFGP